MKFKIGDNIVYLGTKEGRTDDSWENYFGKYGIKRGSKGVIKNIEYDGRIFVQEDGRPVSSGSLYECDIAFSTTSTTLKNPTHVVIWDEENRDPHRFFTSEKEAKDFVKELSENPKVKKDSMVFVVIKSSQKVNITKNVRLMNYKI